MQTSYRATMPAFVTVIIPTFRAWSSLRKCLSVLAEQSYPKQAIEVIVVNNDPDDPPPRDLQHYDFVRIVSEYKAGSYAARNTGLQAARGDIVAFTDADCVPARDWIEQAVNALSRMPDASRVGGRIHITFNGQELSATEMYEKAYAFRQQDFVALQGMAATANMITYRHVFDAVGLFREDLMSGGDAEWGRRAQAAGYSVVYAPDCVVYHPARRHFAEIARKTRRVAGGHLVLGNTASSMRAWGEIFVEFLPPGRSAIRVLCDPALNVREKITAVAIRYILRILGASEKARLLLGQKAYERQ